MVLMRSNAFIMKKIIFTVLFTAVAFLSFAGGIFVANTDWFNDHFYIKSRQMQNLEIKSLKQYKKALYSKDTTYDTTVASSEMANHYHEYFEEVIDRIRNLNYPSEPVKKAVLSYLDGYVKRKAQMEYTLFPCQDNPTDDCAYGRIFSYRYAIGMMEFDRTELLTYRMILNYMYDNAYFTKEEIEKVFEE